MQYREGEKMIKNYYVVGEDHHKPKTFSTKCEALKYFKKRKKVTKNLMQLVGYKNGYAYGIKR